MYGALILFSFLLFCLCCARLNYTSVKGFYDPIIVELLVTSLLTIPWASYIIYCIYKRVETKYVSKFREEIIGLSVLWIFWIVGAADASAIWGTLSVCLHFSQCEVLSALMAFSWLGWITLSGILVLDTLFVVANKFWMEPLHGRLDPRMSRAIP